MVNSGKGSVIIVPAGITPEFTLKVNEYVMLPFLVAIVCCSTFFTNEVARYWSESNVTGTFAELIFVPLLNSSALLYLTPYCVESASGLTDKP
ncbi:hypothetical protein OG1X_1442 [Enterococcus faecalis OG1X]|nr:hypothetical protein OG1X_1442 [Enterococcus faecalis OG1X]